MESPVGMTRCQLVFGEKVSVADYSDRLPCPSERSFLLFAKGACGPGTPFREIGALIDLEHATHACSLYVSVGLWG